MIDFLVYAFSGKLLIWLTRKFPPIRYLVYKWKFSRKLFECNLCLGVWIYFFLSWFFNIDVKQIKNRLMKNIILAGFTSLAVHLVSLGWQEQFEELVIVEDASKNIT